MRTDDRSPSFTALSDDALDTVSGGMRLEGMRESDNVEDVRHTQEITCDPSDPYGENDPGMGGDSDDDDYGGGDYSGGGDGW